MWTVSGFPNLNPYPMPEPKNPNRDGNPDFLSAKTRPISVVRGTVSVIFLGRENVSGFPCPFDWPRPRNLADFPNPSPNPNQCPNARPNPYPNPNPIPSQLSYQYPFSVREHVPSGVRFSVSESLLESLYESSSEIRFLIRKSES